MTTLMNRQYYLDSRPEGLPTAANVPFRDVPVADPADGEVVLQNLYISLDPAIRGWMGDDPNYIEPIPLGDPVRSTVIGRVVAGSGLRVARKDGRLVKWKGRGGWLHGS